MGRNFNLVAASLAFVVSLNTVCCQSVRLTHMSTVYLPYRFEGNAPRFQFDSSAVERAVFEPTGKYVYAVGERLLHIVNASDPKNLTYVTHVSSGSQELTDLVTCGGAIFVTYINKDDPVQSGVLQYGLYDTASSSIAFVREIHVGHQPDMIMATRNCTLLVALQNQPFVTNGRVQDPPGAVGVIRFPGGVSSTPVVTQMNFTAFDSRFANLSQSGVRWVYRGNNNRFSDDVGPEYVAVNADNTKAYVALKDNNAVAVVDLATSTVTDMYGLGFKNWSQFLLDPSDMDNGPNLSPWPVYGMYQPDALQWFRWAGQKYVITANEGQASDYDSINFSEGTRARNIMDSQLAMSVTAETRRALQSDSKLGRLLISTLDGKNAAGQYENFYTFGGRSFSIWRASDMAQVFDSGSELSQKIKEQRPDLFNNCFQDRFAFVPATADKCSCDLGLEPEVVLVAEVKGQLLIFLGMENPGVIAIYSVAPGKDLKPRFQSLYTAGIPPVNFTWDHLYNAGHLHAVDPESIQFLGPDSGLADFPMLLVAGTASGTLSFLRVDVTGGAAVHTALTGHVGAALTFSLVVSLFLL